MKFNGMYAILFGYLIPVVGHLEMLHKLVLLTVGEKRTDRPNFSIIKKFHMKCLSQFIGLASMNKFSLFLVPTPALIVICFLDIGYSAWRQM